MISIEYIMDGNKTLLTITFDRMVMKHMQVKCNDYLNFYQSQYSVNYFTLFKADSGYRIIRAINKKKMYRIQVKHSLKELREFSIDDCTYYKKNNGFIRIIIKPQKE